MNEKVYLFRYPPSVNRLWRYTARGVYRTKQYRAYLDECALLHRSSDPPFDAPVRCEILASPPDKRVRDLDNLAKCLLDTLQHINAITNDHLVHELHMKWDRMNVQNGVMVMVAPLNAIDAGMSI